MSAKSISLLAAIAGILFVKNLSAADGSGKAVCNSTRAGEFWPATANASSQTIYESAREGQLEICARGLYRYAWKPLTISYQQLSAEAKQKEERRTGKHKLISAVLALSPGSRP